LFFLTICSFAYGQEICDNGIDNDLDGYINYYDEECPCDDEIFNAQCDQECVDTVFSEIKMRLKWKTTSLNKGTGFTINNFTVYENKAYINGHDSITEGIKNKILEIDLPSQSISDFLVIDTLSAPINFGFFMYRNSSLEEKRIVLKNLSLDLLSFRESNLLWRKSIIVGDFSRLVYLKAADINADGVSEIYSGNIIVGENGNLLFRGSSSEGCNFRSGSNTCTLGANSIAADFTDHVGLELACGNVIYEVNLINTVDSVGNSVNIITAPPEVPDGFTGMGDFDSDGLLDVVVSRSNGNGDGGIWVWDPRSTSLIASYYHDVGMGRYGSVPVVADINNDCIPEIIVIHENELSVYQYDGTSQLKVFSQKRIIDDSGYTIPTVFDLNSDGINEIIFRDEEYLFILDGPSGMTLDSFPLISLTRNEQPIITDGDGDGHAEILIQGSDDDPDSLRLFCLESANRPWAPARRVWNQTGYHVTNVNDDLTIPQYQQNSAAFFDTDSCFLETCPQVYNTYGVQATYRTQKGCQVFEELVPELGSEVETMEDCDSIVAQIVINTNFEEIEWFPLEYVSCADCDSVIVKSDLDVTVVLTARSGSCMRSDTFTFELQNPELIEKSDILCFGDSLYFGDQFRTSTGLYSFTSEACDSSFVLDLLILDSLSSSSEEAICQGDSISIEGQVFREAGVYDISFITSRGCDSSVTLDLIVIEPVPEVVVRSICDGDSLVIENQIFRQEGSYSILLEAADGCDSIIDLSLIVYEVTSNEEIATICNGDSIMIEEDWYFGGDVVPLIGTSMVGCDSITLLSIEVVDILSDEETIMICQGDSIEVHDQWVYAEGSYPKMFEAVSGCDSVFTYNVIVQGVVTTEQLRDICAGDTLIIGAEMLTEEGQYDLIYDAVNGCDSIVTLQLNVVPLLVGFQEMSLCFGDSILIEGTWVSEAGNYEYVIESEMGCDSIAMITVVELPIDISNDTLTACIGDSILFMDSYYFENRMITDTVHDSECSEIQNTWFSFTDQLVSSEQLQLCIGDSVIIGSLVIYSSDTIVLPLVSSSGCDSLHTVMIELIVEEFELPQDTVVDVGFILDYALDLDTSEWLVEWSSSNYNFECPDCIVQSVNVDQQIDIVIDISNEMGCSYQHSFTIRVAESDDVIWPNIFTPNNDGFNDQWVIDMSRYPVNRLTVFDRWGNIVHSSSNNEVIIWDGRHNGTDVVLGVYVFQLRYQEEGSSTKTIYSDITIIK